MNIGVPRYLIVGMAGLFSAYHLVLATYSLTQHIPRTDGPIFLAMALYGLASIMSLVPLGPTRIPIWMAAINLAVVIALPDPGDRAARTHTSQTDTAPGTSPRSARS